MFSSWSSACGASAFLFILLCLIEHVNAAVITTTVAHPATSTSSPPAAQSELQCYTCSSYMNECKKSVDNLSGRVSTTPCNSKCFSRRGEDDAIYRGCFDGFVGVPDLKHDFIGCTAQNWNGRSLMWCFCDTDLCNGAYINPAVSRPRPSTSSSSSPSSSHLLSLIKNIATTEQHDDNNAYSNTESTNPAPSNRQHSSIFQTNNIYTNNVHSNGATANVDNIVHSNSNHDDHQTRGTVKGKLSYAADSERTREAEHPTAKSGHAGDEVAFDNKQSYKIFIKDSESHAAVEPTSISTNEWEQLKNWEIPGDAKERSEKLVQMKRVRDDPSAEYYHGPEELAQLNHQMKHQVIEEPNDYQETSWPDGFSEDNFAIFDPTGDNSFWDQQVEEKNGDDEGKKQSYHVGGDVGTFDIQSDRRNEINAIDKVAKSLTDSANPEAGEKSLTDKDRISQIECTRSGYYQNQYDCTSFIACLLHPGLQIPVVHVMSCPRGLYWDDGYKICLEYSNTCKDGDTYYKQIYNPRPLPPFPLPTDIDDKDDLTYHKYNEMKEEDNRIVQNVINLGNVRVKLQDEPTKVLAGNRNYFKSLSIQSDDTPLEQLPEVFEGDNATALPSASDDSLSMSTLDDVTAIDASEPIMTGRDDVIKEEGVNVKITEPKFTSTNTGAWNDERRNFIPRPKRKGGRRVDEERNYYEEVHLP